MKKLVLACAAVVATCLAATAETPVHATAPDKSALPEDADAATMAQNLVERADSAARDGRYADAAVMLSDALSRPCDEASRVMLLSNLGMVYSYMGRDSLAVATLDKALGLAPRMVAVICNRAGVNMRAGRDGEAYDDYSRAIDIDSANLEARYYRGIMALYAGMPEVARRDFDVLSRTAPESLGTWIAEAAYRSLTRDDLGAVPYYKKIVARDPAPEYYAGLAGCHLALGDLTEASATLAEGMGLYPEDAELYYYRAWLNRDRLLLDDARGDARRAVELGADPDRVAALFKEEK